MDEEGNSSEAKDGYVMVNQCGRTFMARKSRSPALKVQTQEEISRARTREWLEAEQENTSLQNLMNRGNQLLRSSQGSSEQDREEAWGSLQCSPGSSTFSTPSVVRATKRLNLNASGTSIEELTSSSTEKRPKLEERTPLTLGSLNNSVKQMMKSAKNLPKNLSQSQQIQQLKMQNAVERMDNSILRSFFKALETIPVPIIQRYSSMTQDTLAELLVVHNYLESKRQILERKIGVNLDASAEELDLDYSLNRPSIDVPEDRGRTLERIEKPFTLVEYDRIFKNDGLTDEFNGYDYLHSREMLKIMKHTFGLQSFRPCQLQAVNAAMSGHDCFVLMPTGGGKSLCFQLPALLSEGVSFVISPLISLVVDQVQRLVSLDIPAVHLLGYLSEETEAGVYRDCANDSPTIKMLYVTPEKIANSDRLNKCMDSLYERNLISRFVIDEAHCVSAWGHDFRPDYVKLNVLRKKYPRVPTMVLTASATKVVRCDVLHQLQLSNPKWFITSLNRPNLRYTILEKRTKDCKAEVTNLIRNRFPDASGIVYCFTRKECEAYAEYMREHNIKAAAYHAGLADDLKRDTQAKWLSEEVKVIAATIAFGMGIDKPNVQYVIHAVLPKSMEGYYQESGRAGRNLPTADCILFYNYCDVGRLRSLLVKEGIPEEVVLTNLENLDKIVSFCENKTDCRRVLQLNHFGEEYDRDQCIKNRETACDNCTMNPGDFTMTNVFKEVKHIVDGVESLNKKRMRVNVTRLTDIFRGCNLRQLRDAGATSSKLFGMGRNWKKTNVERLIHKLLLEGYLKEDIKLNKSGMASSCVKVGPRSEELRIVDTVMFPMAAHVNTLSQSLLTDMMAPKQSKLDVELKQLESRCYHEIMGFVIGLADAWQVPLDSVLNPAAVQIIAQRLPLTEDDMLKIPHVTKSLFDRCLRPILDTTNNYEEEKNQLLAKYSANS